MDDFSQVVQKTIEIVKSKGGSIKHLAIESGVNRVTLHRWANGEGGIPRFEARKIFIAASERYIKELETYSTLK